MEDVDDYPNHRLIGSSFLCLVSAGYALARGLHVAAALVSVVCLTSLAYWSNPRQGVRRNVDICAVVVCGVYQTFVLAPVSMTGTAYVTTVAAGLACYLLSRSAREKSVSAWLHVGVHVWGNLGNVVLYSGIGTNV